MVRIRVITQRKQSGVITSNMYFVVKIQLRSISISEPMPYLVKFLISIININISYSRWIELHHRDNDCNRKGTNFNLV